MIKQCTSIIIVSAKILCIKSPNKLPYNFTVLRTTLCTVTSVTVNLNWNLIYEHLITTVVILFTPKKRRHYKTGMRSKVPYAHMVFFSMQPPLQILSIFLSQLPKIRHWIVYYCFCACICTYMFLLWLWFLFCVLTFTNCIHFPSHFQQLQSFVFIPDFFSKNAVYFNTSKKYYHCHLNHKCFLSARGAHQLLVYVKRAGGRGLPAREAGSLCSWNRADDFRPSIVGDFPFSFSWHLVKSTTNHRTMK